MAPRCDDVSCVCVCAMCVCVVCVKSRVCKAVVSVGCVCVCACVCLCGRTRHTRSVEDRRVLTSPLSIGYVIARPPPRLPDCAPRRPPPREPRRPHRFARARGKLGPRAAAHASVTPGPAPVFRVLCCSCLLVTKTLFTEYRYRSACSGEGGYRPRAHAEVHTRAFTRHTRAFTQHTRAFTPGLGRAWAQGSGSDR